MSTAENKNKKYQFAKTWKPQPDCTIFYTQIITLKEVHDWSVKELKYIKKKVDYSLRSFKK